MNFFLIFLLSTLPWTAFANIPTLDSLSDSDLNTVVQEFAANFVHTSATPPTSLGKVFGVEAALISGVTESKGIERISKSIDPQSDIKFTPHAWLLGGVSIPYGVSVELNVLPEVDLQGIKMKHSSVGLKWSVTDKFFKNLPFDLAVRTYYTVSEISYRQTVSNPSFPGTSVVDVSFKNAMVGGDTLFGVDFKVVEPYVGVGFVQTTGRLSGRSQTSTPYSLYDDLSSQEKASKQDSVRFIVGARLHLTALNLGLEYTHVFGTQRLSAKVGLQF